MERMTGEMPWSILRGTEMTNSNLFFFIMAKPSTTSDNIKDRRKSPFATHLESKLRSLRTTVCISVTSSVGRQILDSPVAMENESAIYVHINEGRRMKSSSVDHTAHPACSHEKLSAP